MAYMCFESFMVDFEINFEKCSEQESTVHQHFMDNQA